MRALREVRRAGMTLVELLAVVAILVVLMGMTVPVIRPAMKNRKLREATRMVDAYVARAKAEAAESGRPVGLWLERKPADPADPNYQAVTSQCIQMYLAEVPPPYQGDLVGDTVRVVPNGLTAPNNGGVWSLNFSAVSEPTLLELIPPGGRFQVRLGHSATLYSGWRNPNPMPLAPNPATPFELIVAPSTQSPADYPDPVQLGQVAPPSLLQSLATSPSHPTFTIYLPPSRTQHKPLELPRGIVIDLSVTGFGSVEFSADGIVGFPWRTDAMGNPLSSNPLGESRNPLVVMFDASGAIDSFYVDNSPRQPQGSLFLMIGREEQVLPNGNPVLDDPELQANVMELGNFWVSVARNGHVATMENANTNPPPPMDSVARKIDRARAFARTGVGAGGGER